MREALLLDLGALVFELHRQGRREPDLLQAKAAELMAVDEEVRALADALEVNESVMQLVATGVAGSCENCGALMSVDARFCASCGAPAVPALSGDGEPAPVAFPGARETDDFPAVAGAEEVGEYEGGEYEDAPYEDTAYEGEEEYEGEEYDERDVGDADLVPGGLAATFEDEPEGAEEPPAEEEPEPELEDEPEPEPEPEDEPEPEPEPEPEMKDEPEPEIAAPPGAEPAAAAPRPAPAAGGQPPRAVADDVLDRTGRAIRGGLARGRRWLRGRSGQS